MAILIALLLLGGTLLFAQTGVAAPKVVTSIAPLHSLASSVMEGVAEPTLLLSPSITPHNFTMQPSHARALAEADLVVWIGPLLETSLVKPLANLSPKQRQLQFMDAPGITIFALREIDDFATDTHMDDAHDDAHKHTHQHNEDEKRDPHLWLDIANAITITKLLADELSNSDPANAAHYQLGMQNSVAALEQLQENIHASLAAHTLAKFVVFHDAYQYFERGFGLTASGVINLNPAAPPSAARLGAIRDTITNHQIGCVFSEPQFSHKLVTKLVAGTATNTQQLDPLGARLLPGSTLYPTLLRNMADDFIACLAK